MSRRPKPELLKVGMLLATLALVTAMTSCKPKSTEPLPPVPEFDASQYLPVIRSQIEDAASAVRLHPEKAENNGQYAMVLHAYAQYEPAVELYSRASLLDRKPGVWLYLKGQSLAALGRTTQAIEALGEARRRRSDDPWIAGTHTLMRRMSGDREAKASELMPLLKNYDTLPELHYTLARLYQLDNNLDEAAAEYERAIELAGPFGAAYYGLGITQMRRGLEDEAASAIALSQQFKDVVAQGSDPHLASIESLNLSDIRLIKKAEKELLRGELSQAAKLLLTAVERNPNSVAAHLSLLGVFSNTGEFEKAEYHYEAARELEPERAKLFYNFGLLRLLQGRYVEAERAFRETLEREPDNADAYVQLALAQRQQRQPDLARFSLSRALRVDPANRFARIQLAQMLRAQGDYQSAVDTLEGYYEPADGGSAHILLLLAKSYNQLGQKQIAVARAELGIEVAGLWQQNELINQFRRQQYLAETN